MSVIETYKSIQNTPKTNCLDVRKYIPFVRRMANKFKYKIPAVLCLDDLAQVGIMALVNVYEKYDPSSGKSFENFASMRVKGAMIDLIRENTPLPKEKISLMRRAQRFIDDTVLTTGRKPRDNVIAEYLKISIEKYQALILEYESVFSVDIDEVALFDTRLFLPEHILDEEQTKKKLITALKSLSDREQKLIALYFMEDLTHAEIGVVLSITESRVSQLMKTALTKLRRMI